MNFSGNVLQSTLDLLSTFSHQQLKTIEAALSLSHTTSSTSSTGTASNFYDHHHCQTPNTWTESETTTTTIASLTDFEELDSPSAVQMNNLPKVPGGGAVGAPGAGVPPQPQAAVAEYLAMQKHAQQCHQQQTQQQNDSAAAAAGGQQPGGHYLGNRQFHANQLSAGIKAGAPPSHVHGPVPPLAMTQQAANLQQAPPIGVGQPMQQAQRQPLALTSTSSLPRPVEQPVQQQSLPSGVAPSPTAPGPANNNNNNNNVTAGGSAVHTTTVKLSYQQKELSMAPVPAPTSNTPAPPVPVRGAQPPAGTATSAAPVLPPLHPLSISSAQSSTPVVAAPSATVAPGKSQEQAKVASPQPHAPPTVSSPTKSSKAEAVEKKGEGVVPPLKLVINSPTSASGGSNSSSSSSSSSSKSPVKPAAPLAIVTTPSKTSMKLATVTTPRIKQTARKNQSALQRSPTNLASISPPKVTAAPATTTPVKGVSASVPAVGAAPPEVTPTTGQQKAQAEKKQVISPPVEKVAPAATTVATPVATQRKREAKAKATPGTSVAALEDGGDAGKAKRNRIRTVPYQIPTPEITLAQKLSIAASAESPLGGVASGSSKRANSRNGSGSSDSGAEDKLTLFYKNEFVAVRNAEDGFFLCQVLQNVYKSSPKIRIRWLSETKKSGVYVPDFYDVTDLECILTNVDLDKEKGEYELPKEEQTRIGNILKKAMGLLEVSEITEDNPDGLDLSIYKDEAQLDRKEEKKARRAANTERAGKTPKSVKKAVVATTAPLVTPGTTKAPAATQATKRASNGVARTPKRAKAVASPVNEALTVDTETPTRVSKRARAIQSPNYREDDDDDLPLLNAVKAASAAEVATTKAATPKAPKVVPAKVEKVETATKAEPVGQGKKKPTPSVEQVKKEVVVPPPTKAVAAPVAASSASPVAKKVIAGKGATVTSVKPGPKPKVAVKEVKKEMKEEAKAKGGVPLKASLTPKGAKKMPVKRKAEPEAAVVPEKKADPPLSTLLIPAKKPKVGSSPQVSPAVGAGSGVVKKGAAVKEVKEQSLAALAESTKKAAAAAAAGSNKSAPTTPAKKQSPGSGKGRGGGRGKK